MSSRFSRSIYVGNLPADIKESEIEDLFYKYGRILDIELKLPPRPPCYCFVEFGSSRDADDAIRGRDGYNFDGCRLRVELAHGGRGSSSANERRSGGRHGAARRSDYRVIVRGLPSSASWQDLKDHMRKAGDVCFAEVSRDSEGTFGMVDYTNHEDMKYAIRKLDDTEFKNPWAKSYIRMKKFEESPRSRSRSRSRSRTPRKARSKSLEQSVSRSPSRSRSASPVKSDRSRSRSPAKRKSRSRSPAKRKSRSRSPAKRKSRSRSPAKRKSRSRSQQSENPGRGPRQSESPGQGRVRGRGQGQGRVLLGSTTRQMCFNFWATVKAFIAWILSCMLFILAMFSPVGPCNSECLS